MSMSVALPMAVEVLFIIRTRMAFLHSLKSRSFAFSGMVSSILLSLEILDRAVLFPCRSWCNLAAALDSRLIQLIENEIAGKEYEERSILSPLSDWICYNHIEKSGRRCEKGGRFC